MGHKIATCNYCGTRAALVLDQARHELACQACGAPLHDLKAMPQPARTTERRPAETHRPPAAAQADPRRRKKRRKVPHYDEVAGRERSGWPGRKKWKKPRKRKSLGRKIFEEVFDVVEDIFD